jgi:predicted transcriptional regulator
VVRMQDYREPKQAVVARREKRRGRGRPRKTCKDSVW